MVEFNFISWIGIGFALAAAVGPIWLLVAQRALAKGWRYGMVSGFGVALADGLYGLLGALGLQAMLMALADIGRWLRIAGGLVIVSIGLRILISSGHIQLQPGSERAHTPSGGYAVAAGSIFLLTLANPLTILSFAAIYTGAGESGLSLGAGSVGAFSGAIFIGSMLWWTTLVGVVAATHSRVDPRLIAWVNRAAGAAMTMLGIRMLF